MTQQAKDVVSILEQAKDTMAINQKMSVQPTSDTLSILIT